MKAKISRKSHKNFSISEFSIFNINISPELIANLLNIFVCHSKLLCYICNAEVGSNFFGIISRGNNQKKLINKKGSYYFDVEYYTDSLNDISIIEILNSHPELLIFYGVVEQCVELSDTVINSKSFDLIKNKILNFTTNFIFEEFEIHIVFDCDVYNEVEITTKLNDLLRAEEL